MLARANRVITASEFRTAVRRGRRTAMPTAVYHRVDSGPDAPLRFGFIISRAVGPAVSRNLLRRRFRAIGRQLVDAGGSGSDIVVRALPGCAERSWTDLLTEMRSILDPIVLDSMAPDRSTESPGTRP